MPKATLYRRLDWRACNPKQAAAYEECSISNSLNHLSEASRGKKQFRVLIGTNQWRFCPEEMRLQAQKTRDRQAKAA
jgi:hypothetical protein